MYSVQLYRRFNIVVWQCCRLPTGCIISGRKKRMSMEYHLNYNDWGKQNTPGEKRIPMPLCLPEIPRGLD
jgi:hypothetical protein